MKVTNSKEGYRDRPINEGKRPNNDGKRPKNNGKSFDDHKEF